MPRGWVLISLLMTLLLVACGPAVPPPPQSPPGVAGFIAEIKSDPSGPSVTVSAQPGDKDPALAVVRITEKTVIVREESKRRIRVPASNLTVGLAVRVWFDGPVQKSLPVQGTGLYLLVTAPD